MDRLLVEVCWDQKKRYSDLARYNRLIDNTVEEMKNIKYFGIFRPLNEAWQWGYIVEVDGYENWEKFEDTLDDRGGDIRKNITHNMTRVYGSTFTNLREIDQSEFSYIHFDIFDWDGVNIGLKEFFDAYLKVLEDKSDIWLMGCYQPWNEPHNWAFIYLYRDLKNFVNVKQELWRAVGRPYRASKFFIKEYRRFNEKSQAP